MNFNLKFSLNSVKSGFLSIFALCTIKLINHFRFLESIRTNLIIKTNWIVNAVISVFMVLNVKSFMSLCIQVSKTQKAAFDLQYLAPTYPFNSCGNGVRFHTAVFWLYFSQISNVICHINLTSDQLKKVSVVSLQSGVRWLMFSHGLFHLKYRRKGRVGVTPAAAYEYQHVKLIHG